MNPRGHESDPMTFMRPRGHPKNIPSPHADFHQVFFGRVVRFPPPEPLPAVACSCDRGAALAAQPSGWGHRASAHGAARAELNATRNLSHPAVDGGAGGDGDGDGDGGAAAYGLPPRLPKRADIYVLREADPLSASIVWGTTCGSSSSSPPSARGRIFDISW